MYKLGMVLLKIISSKDENLFPNQPQSDGDFLLEEFNNILGTIIIYLTTG